jgi:hypothetical protein
MKMLQEEFQELLQLSTAAPKPTHGVVHHILMNGRPVFAKARRLEPANRRIAEEVFIALEKGRYCVAQHITMGLPAAHGAQEGRELAPMQ